jgi:hypothetical protein
VYNLIKKEEQRRLAMSAKYPRGYRKADERTRFYEEETTHTEPIKPQVPKDSIIKFHSGALAELKDPLRRSEKVIRKEEIFDLQLDLYLFGKGADINE